MIGLAVAAISLFVTDSVAPVSGSLPFADATLDSSARVPGPDSTAVQAGRDSVSADTLREVEFDSTVVKGVRRYRRNAAIDPSVWSKPSSMGLPGALEALRAQPGVAFSGDLSGHFSSTGMPVEGSVVTWNGAEIIWPWHFGGLFGALDDWATGSVAWHNPSGTPSPTRGGGWLETEGRAGGDSDQVHAAARLGFVAGGAATWGRRGDWGWQATARRTWLDWGLDFARDRKWTDQKMKVLFQDATAQATWQRGPWKVSAGWFGSDDTLGIGTGDTKDSLMGLSWQNIAVPVGVWWREGPWSARAQGSWSRYRRTDSDIETKDTLGLTRAEAVVERDLSSSRSLSVGVGVDSWTSTHGIGMWDGPFGWTGDTDRLWIEPTVRFEEHRPEGEWKAWVGLVHAEHDAAAPTGGVSGGWRSGLWRFEAGLERKLVPLAILDQSQTQIDAASPAWILPPGSAARTTQFQATALRRESGPDSDLRTEFRTLGWLRLNEGLWNWEPIDDRRNSDRAYQARRSDGWGAGAEIDGSIALIRLELSGRQTLSLDVLRDRPGQGVQGPSRWAPWDQRWRSEIAASWNWIGSVRQGIGRFGWRSELSGKWSTGLFRGFVIAHTTSDQGRNFETGPLDEPDRVYGKKRTPYFRLDFTPLRLGREGRWSVWWTLVNVTNETNLAGWTNNSESSPAVPVSQIPFLPVVFGAQIQI